MKRRRARKSLKLNLWSGARGNFHSRSFFVLFFRASNSWRITYIFLAVGGSVPVGRIKKLEIESWVGLMMSDSAVIRLFLSCT